MYGYSGLHYLRRIAAYLWADKPIPSPGKDNPEKDPLLEKYYSSLGDLIISYFIAIVKAFMYLLNLAK